MDKIAVMLPYPPSVNKYWLNAKGGKHKYIQKDGRIFREKVREICSQTKPIVGQIQLTVLLAMPDNRIRDLDNILKALLDGIVKSGIIADDDSRIVPEIIVKRVGKIKGGKVIVIFNKVKVEVNKTLTIEDLMNLKE